MSRRRLLLPLLLLAAAAPSAAAPATKSKIITLEPDSAALRQNELMFYVDEDLKPSEAATEELLADLSPVASMGSPMDLFRPMHPLYTELRRGLQIYRTDWARLPDVQIGAGPPLKSGDKGGRVALLRERLGLAAGDSYDAATAARVKAFQKVHGLQDDGVAGASTIEALNRGWAHYIRVALVNLERASNLPVERDGRYILVDAGAARLWLYENGRAVDTMRVIVGSPVQPTPMMAAYIRFAEVNPYWNLPPDFTQNRIAANVLAQGLSYLSDRGYEVLADWSDEAPVVPASEVDWQAVERGESPLRVRQLPGPNNSMGAIKFMMPNHLGIYLHDTPNKALFAEADRWISNGCVRVEDARRLAAWLFGAMPKPERPDRPSQADLAEPVPAYITYLTIGRGEDGGLVFRPDRYNRDASAVSRLERMFEQEKQQKLRVAEAAPAD